MDMSLTTALVIVAALGAVALVFQHKERVFPAVALLASGVEVLVAFKVLKITLKSVSVWLILGAVLFLAGAIVWARASGKGAASGATVVTVVGALQVLIALKFLTV